MWKHPATKQSHMIDYIVMWADRCSFYTDVQVMRGANCWSDHSMVRAKVRIHFPRLRKTPARTLPIAVHALWLGRNREAHQQKITEHLSKWPLDPEQSIEKNWKTLKSCITSAGEESVDHGRKRQAYWFLDAADTLQPLLYEKNVAQERFLQVNSVSANEIRRRWSVRLMLLKRSGSPE